MTRASTGPAPALQWALAQQRRSLLAWGIAIVAVSGLYIGFWPSMESMDIGAMTDSLPPAMVDALGYDQIGTAAGYLSSTVYGLLAPALLLVFATGKGGSLVAGDEEAGVLELESTAPISRRSLYAGRLCALWAMIAALTALVGGVTVALLTPLDMDVAVADVAATCVGLVALGGMIGTVALATGGATGRRSIAIGVGAFAAVGSFMLDAIGAGTGTSWMVTLSPFSWYLGDDPLQNGLDGSGLVALLVVATIAGIIGLVRYERRDLMT